MNSPGITQNRLNYLDSLRGIASISVVLSHFFLAYRLDLRLKLVNFSPFHFFYDGFSAVTLFFILSGYVLTLSLMRDKELKIESFYVKRVFRIMPAYLTVLILSFFAYYYYVYQVTNPESSLWINSFWNKPLDLYHFLKQAIFLNPKNFAELVPHNWSLQIEMLFSFLMPFLYILYRELNKVYFLTFILILFIFFDIPVFVFHFSAGIFLAFNQEAAVNFIGKLKIKSKTILILFIWLMYSYRYTVPMYYYYITRKQSIILGNESFIWLVTGVGAFMILLYCISSYKIQTILNSKVLVYIGKISYAIYLIHMVILFFVIPKFIHLFNSIGINNNFIVLGASLLILLCLTILCAHYLTVCIEIPLSKFGNYFFKNRFQKKNKTLLSKKLFL